MNVVILELTKSETNKFGFNLEGNLQLVAQLLSALFKAVAEGTLKLEIP